MTATRPKPLRRFQRLYFVYILANVRGMLYVGLTDDLRKRTLQHKAGTFDGYTKRYAINRVMYFETYSDSKFAEFREKQVKKYRREKKIALFKDSNPKWQDLSREIFDTSRRAPGLSAPVSPAESVSDDMDPSLRSGFQKKAPGQAEKI